MDEERGTEEHVVAGLDVLDILGFMDKKKKRFLAIALNELEEIYDAAGISRDSPEFQYTRKLILDLVNEYTRSILRLIFGEIETEKYVEKKEKEEEPEEE
jgi:hypothetical protein